MESVVRVYSFHEGEARFAGSGFLAHRTTSGSNLVMTCHHVLKNSTNARIYFPDGTRFDARIVNKDANTDLALLRYVCHGSLPKALRFRRSATPYVGKVYLIGYFVLMDGSIPIRPGISSGEIIGPPISLSGTGPRQNISEQTSQAGASGSPLVDNRDDVIGVQTQICGGLSNSVTLDNVHQTLAAWSNTKGKNLEISEMLDIIAAQDP